MMKITLLLLAAAMLSSCSPESGRRFAVNGTLSNFQDPVEKIYFTENGTAVDSAQVNDGRFTLNISSDSSKVFKIEIPGLRYQALLFLDNGKDIQMNLDWINGPSADDGGHANSIYYGYQETKQRQLDSANAIFKALIREKASREERMAANAEHLRQARETVRFLALENKDNMAGAAIFADGCHQFEKLEDYDTCMKALTYGSTFPAIAKGRASLANRLATAEGQPFRDFTGTGLDGKEISLSHYVGQGKYVLVDFWASWCRPCRAEIPNLVSAHEKYAGRHFMVLGIGVRDKLEKFRKAVEEEQLAYPQIYTSDTREITDLYGIRGIPQIILFGPDGRILKRNLRGGQIDKVINEYLAKN